MKKAATGSTDFPVRPKAALKPKANREDAETQRRGESTEDAKMARMKAGAWHRM